MIHQKFMRIINISRIFKKKRNRLLERYNKMTRYFKVVVYEKNYKDLEKYFDKKIIFKYQILNSNLYMVILKRFVNSKAELIRRLKEYWIFPLDISNTKTDISKVYNVFYQNGSRIIQNNFKKIKENSTLNLS